MENFIRGLPKAELHVHVEGTLEPEMAVELAARNHITLAHASAGELRAAYAFHDLQSFLDVYYETSRVLLCERDFYDLTWAYLERARQDHVLHAEISFDPQTHTERGVSFADVVGGIHRALQDGERRLGITSRLILCFLRHVGEAQAQATLDEALGFRQWIAAIGLDSTELGNPPARFVNVFARARREGFRVVAHAGEEGPPDYVWQALDLLGAERIDHGVRAMEDARLVDRLRREQVPLTVCPLSNVCLRVFPSLSRHNLRELLAAGLLVTINSDDPAYFGGFVADNYLAAWRALGLGRDDLVGLAANGFHAAFLDEARRSACLGALHAYAAKG